MDRLKPGQSAVIQAVGGSGSLRHHLLDMGLTPQTEVTLQKTAPMGDPVQIKLRGYELTLRLDEARKIEIGAVYQKTGVETRPLRYQAIDHPAVGEQSTVETDHPKKTEGIPAGQPLRFALAGNQNCGKTTLFNQLTGANQHVGNFPGVTVDRKDGTIGGHRDRPAGHLLPLPLFQRGDRHPALFAGDEAGRHHQHRRCHEHRAQSLFDHAAHGAGHPHGPGPEHDGRGAGQRGHGPGQRAGAGPGHPGGAHLGGEERGHQRADRPRHPRRPLPGGPGAHRLLPGQPQPE